MSGLLTRDAILAASDLKTEEVEVQEWNGAVRVRTMTGTDRDVFEQSLVAVDADGKRKPDLSAMRVKLLAMTMVDEHGDRLFSFEEVALLGTKSAAAIERVFVVAQRLNGLSAEAVETETGNSGAGPSAGSTSDSPATSE